MHHTSVAARCLAEEEMNAAAPIIVQMPQRVPKSDQLATQESTQARSSICTLSNPYVWMAEEPRRGAHELPDPEFVKQTKLRETG